MTIFLLHTIIIRAILKPKYEPISNGGSCTSQLEDLRIVDNFYQTSFFSRCLQFSYQHLMMKVTPH